MYETFRPIGVVVTSETYCYRCKTRMVKTRDQMLHCITCGASFPSEEHDHVPEE